MAKYDLLVGCEMSGIVRDAFLSTGISAISCDLKKTLSPGPHLTMDIFEAIDLIRPKALIAFPPCTFLANCQYSTMIISKKRMLAALNALEFFKKLYYSPVEFIALENPPGVVNGCFKKPSQIVRPWNFGNDHNKDICLWLKNLPPLIYGPHSNGRRPVSNHVNSRMSQEKRSEIKSMFFPEVARAMAEQWGTIFNS